ncbi:hypothetical protein IQ07DRAFT_582557 [Pyrenochaeta sp. DS3sAY3a]|nr:hypothetical protein IQ07DRAFT_582557 [Pyrenochaeta sp. DS3sAY3a]
MADPVSITASILTLVASGMAIAKGLHTIANTMGSAGQEVRFYATDIQLLASVLENISEQLNKKARRSWSRAEHVILDIIDVCREILEPLNEIQVSLTALLVRYKESSEKLRQVSARVWWFFKYKDQVLYYRQCLRDLNITLNTQLAAMKMNTVDNVAIKIQIQRSSLELCTAEAERLWKEGIKIQIGDGQDRPFVLPTSSVNASRINTDSVKTQNTARQRAVPGQEPTRASGNTESLQALMSYPERLNGDHHGSDGLSPHEVNEVEGMILQTLGGTSDTSRHETTEDLRALLRKVIRYTRNASESTTVPSSEIQSEADKPAEPMDADRAGAKEVSSVSAASNPDRNQDALPPARESLGKEIVLFTHLDGIQYQVPYEAARTWDEAKELWLSLPYPAELYYQSDTHSRPSGVDFNAMPFFQAKRMRFKGPDGQYFMPQFWEYFVRPGWVVTLEFRDRINWSGKERDAEVQDSWIFEEYREIMEGYNCVRSAF